MLMDRPDKRSFLRGMTGVAALALQPLLGACGGGSDDAGPLAAPRASRNPQPAPPAFVAGTVSLGALTGASVGRSFSGLSYEKSSLYRKVFSPEKAALIAIFRLLGPTVLRIGGNSCDGMLWTPQGSGATKDQVARVDIDRLAAFLAASDFRAIYDVNLKTEADPANAAAEVAYVAQALGDRLMMIEIGNEPDGYGWDYDAFATKWLSFAAAIRLLVPGIRIGAPGLAFRTNIDSWSAALVRNPQSRLASVTHHYYRGSGAAAQTIAGLLSQDMGLVNNIAVPLLAAADGLPTRLTEHNSYFSGGAPGVSDANASALWAVQDLFTLAASGLGGANFHGGGSSAYTPIEDSDGTVTAVRPLFYGLVMFAMAGAGRLRATTLDAGGLDAAAYALQADDGSTVVLVLNKDPSSALRITVTTGVAARAADLRVLTLPGLSALAGASLQGSAIGTDGTFQPGAAYTLSVQDGHAVGFVPPAAAGLFRVGAAA